MEKSGVTYRYVNKRLNLRAEIHKINSRWMLNIMSYFGVSLYCKKFKTLVEAKKKMLEIEKEVKENGKQKD